MVVFCVEVRPLAPRYCPDSCSYKIVSIQNHHLGQSCTDIFITGHSNVILHISKLRLGIYELMLIQDYLKINLKKLQPHPTQKAVEDLFKSCTEELTGILSEIVLYLSNPIHTERCAYNALFRGLKRSSSKSIPTAKVSHFQDL